MEAAVGQLAVGGGSGAETSAYGQRRAHTHVYMDMELCGAPSFLRKSSTLIRRRLYLVWLYDRLTYYGRTQLLEEEVDLRLRDAEGTGHREVDAGVGIMVRAVVCEADSRNGLGLGGGHLGVITR